MVHGDSYDVGVGGCLLGGCINTVGTFFRYGNGAEHVLKYEMVTAEGEIITISKSNVTIHMDANGNLIVSMT